MSIADQVILITGGARGIGAETARNVDNAADPAAALDPKERP